MKINTIPTKLRSGDEVIVVAGKDLGKKGTLRKIHKSKNKAIVTGINMVKKHTKPNPEMGITGGVVEQEAAIDLSNLAIWNPSKKSKDRISYSTDKDGKKIRLFKCKEVKLNPNLIPGTQFKIKNKKFIRCKNGSVQI